MEPPKKSKCGDHQTLSDHNPGKNWENNGVRYTEMSLYHYLYLLSGKPLKPFKTFNNDITNNSWNPNPQF